MRRLLYMVLALFLLAGCGGGGHGGEDSSKTDPLKTGEDGGSEIVTLTSIDISAPNEGIPVGLTQQLQATGKYSDGTERDLTKKVTWSCTDGRVSVTPAGLVTAIAVGEAIVYAEFEDHQDQTPLRVVDAILESLAITVPREDLPLGLEVDLTATGLFSDGKRYDLTQSVEWSSSDEAVITVDNTAGSKGRVKGLQKDSSATVYAAYEGETDALTFRVTEAALVGIDIDPPEALISMGKTYPYVDFRAIGIYSDGEEQDLTEVVEWSSSCPEVADLEGGWAVGRILGYSAGDATITAAFEGNEGSAPVLVVNPAVWPEKLQIVPEKAEIGLDGAVRLRVECVLSDGMIIDITSWVDWTVADESIAFVEKLSDNSCLLFPEAPGLTTVEAVWSGLKFTAQISIR